VLLRVLLSYTYNKRAQKPRERTGYRADYHHAGRHQGGIFSFRLGSKRIRPWRLLERTQGESGVVQRGAVVGWEGEKWGAKRVCLEKSLRKRRQKEEGTEAGNDPNGERT
jgi:hypothetical protein